MAVIIQNISKKYSHIGIQTYIIRINDKEICKVKHRAEHGLSVLLFKAACAVKESELKQDVMLLNNTIRSYNAGD